MSEDKAITFDDVKKWLAAHTDDTEAMNWISKMVYPFTSRFEEKNGR